MGSMGLQSCDVLAITDETVLGVSAVLNAVGKVVTQSQGGLEKTDPVIITQASSLGRLPVETSTIDFVICFCSSVEFPNGKFLEEISRVMKPGGTILICKTSRSVGQVDKVASSPERKLLMAGFLEIQTVQMNTAASSEDVQSLGIKAKKASWKIGSSFSIKKTTKSLPKIQIDDDMDLIDEDSLLTEEDLKKPKLPMPPVGDCEVGSTRKACKNCSCGRAEAEAKVVKLGPTDGQLNNPQSACGSCGLGDAFRCGTCPYKGLPPFKLGEKVSLPSNFLAADI